MADPILRSGDLRHRVELQANLEVQDPRGDTTSTWATVGIYWAFVRPVSGQEKVIAAQLKAQVSHNVTMRYTPNVTISPNMRLLFHGRILNIQSATNVDERNYAWSIYCLETEPD